MRDQFTSWAKAHLASCGLAGKCLLLSVLVMLAFLLLSPVAYWQQGGEGLIAAAVAAVVCWIGAAAALVLSDLFRAPEVALYGLAGSMVLRTGLPLLAIVVLYAQGGRLAEAGIVYYLLAFYLVTLVVETTLSLPRSEDRAPTAGVTE